MSPMRIGCLSTINQPNLTNWLRALERTHADLCVICDERLLSDRDIEIFHSRTGHRIPGTRLYRHNGVPFYFVGSHNDIDTAYLVKGLGLDLLLNCGTPRILKGEILKAPRIGVLNCHPGKLPDYKGCSAVEWALYNGDPVCNTAHLMTEEIDSGPIIAIEEVAISPDDSFEDIRVKTHEANVELMAKAVKMLMADEKATLAAAGPGKYWKPIPDELLEELKAKRANAA